MIIESSVIAGVVRDTEFSIPVYSDIECFHRSSPVSLLILYKYPALPSPVHRARPFVLLD